MSRKKEQLWIGTAHVEQSHRDGVLGDADEAFVNVIALATDKADFRRQVKRGVESLELALRQLNDAEPLEHRLSKHSIVEDLSKLARRVQRTGKIAFDVFCTFDHGS